MSNNFKEAFEKTRLAGSIAARALDEVAKIVKPDGLNLDTNIKPDWALKNLSNVTLQGGLDPKILLKSNKKMIQEAKKYLDAFKDVSYIFNLGHGMRPETEPKKVKKLIKFVRNYK